MTDNEPRVLITAIKCQKCGHQTTEKIFTLSGTVRALPYEVSADEARRWPRALTCFQCKSESALIATAPVPTSHLVGGFEWMHAASGYGHLGEYDPATGEVVP